MNSKVKKNNYYLTFIRSQKCVVTDSYYNVVAHHVRLNAGAGMGQKPDDYLTLPIHANKHYELHNTGEKSFWAKNKIDPFCSMLIYICEFVAKHEILELSELNLSELKTNHDVLGKIRNISETVHQFCILNKLI